MFSSLWYRKLMPDPEKLRVLDLAQYQVRPACALCLHGAFRPGSDWGSCARYRYIHEKHKTERSVSVHRLGLCASRYEPDQAKIADLARSGFDRFLRA